MLMTTSCFVFVFVLSQSDSALVEAKAILEEEEYESLQELQDNIAKTQNEYKTARGKRQVHLKEELDEMEALHRKYMAALSNPNKTPEQVQ